MARRDIVRQNCTDDGAGARDSTAGFRSRPVLKAAGVGISDEGHLTLVLPPGEVVTESMAAEVSEKVQRLAGPHRLPMLLTLTGVDSISRGARDVFSAARELSAVAVIGMSPVDRVIANFLLGGEVQPCPTRYFSRETEAREWLKRYAA